MYNPSVLHRCLERFTCLEDLVLLHTFGLSFETVNFVDLFHTDLVGSLDQLCPWHPPRWRPRYSPRWRPRNSPRLLYRPRRFWPLREPRNALRPCAAPSKNETASFVDPRITPSQCDFDLFVTTSLSQSLLLQAGIVMIGSCTLWASSLVGDQSETQTGSRNPAECRSLCSLKQFQRISTSSPVIIASNSVSHLEPQGDTLNSPRVSCSTIFQGLYPHASLEPGTERYS